MTSAVIPHHPSSDESSTLHIEPPASARVRPDGSVLLSLSQDMMYRLNCVGTMAWAILAEHRNGLTARDLASRLGAEFEAINREGKYHFDVPADQLQSDMTHLLEKLAELKLLWSTTDSSGLEVFSVADDVLQTPGRNDTGEPQLSTGETTADSVDEAPTACSKFDTFVAFVGLAAFDAVLKLAGFNRLVRVVERWRTAVPLTTDRDLIKRIRAAVDRAQMYYPKKAMCLQHSAVTTCLLRRRGVPAEMVLAAQDFPPRAHAWAEVAGEVVNDKPSVQTKYAVLRRV